MIVTFLIVLPLLLSPGPANLVSFALAARFGMLNILRFQFGILVMYGAGSILFGLLVMQTASYIANEMRIIQVCGGLFIIYLGIRLANRNDFDKVDINKPSFLNGAILQLLNPKYPAVVFTIYSSRPEEPLLITAGVITSVGASGLLAYSLAGSIIHGLITSKKLLRLLNIAFCIMLIAVGAWIVVQAVVSI